MLGLSGLRVTFSQWSVSFFFHLSLLNHPPPFDLRPRQAVSFVVHLPCFTLDYYFHPSDPFLPLFPFSECGQFAFNEHPPPPNRVEQLSSLPPPPPRRYYPILPLGRSTSLLCPLSQDPHTKSPFPSPTFPSRSSPEMPPVCLVSLTKG